MFTNGVRVVVRGAFKSGFYFTHPVNKIKKLRNIKLRIIYVYKKSEQFHYVNIFIFSYLQLRNHKNLT